MRLSNIALAITALYGATFSPASLFAAGEQGVWYDPSDLTTLFQDKTGTTPVTAVEQPVGLMLDKSKSLALGSELVNNSFWVTGAGWTFSNGVATAVSASSDAYRQATGPVSLDTCIITFRVTNYSGGTVRPALYGQTGQLVNGDGTYSFIAVNGNGDRFLYFTGSNFTGTIDNISVKTLAGNHAYQSTSAARPVLSARVNLLTATSVLSTQSVTTVATTYTLFFSGTGAITLTGTATGVYTAGTYTITCTAGTLIATVAGLVTQADLRVANDGVGLPAYQRVNTSTDYDTVGFPLYIKPNGSSQFMVTNSINFSATNKMTVWAGVRKLSDAASAMFLELGPNTSSNNGSFFIGAPVSASSPSYEIDIKGTAENQLRYTTFTSPVTGVLALSATTAAVNAAASQTLRVNTSVMSGTNVASANSTGNFGNYPLYLFARAGSSLWFGGRMYSMIVRGAASDATQISQTETYVNSKTKAWG